VPHEAGGVALRRRGRLAGLSAGYARSSVMELTAWLGKISQGGTVLTVGVGRTLSISWSSDGAGDAEIPVAVSSSYLRMALSD
jgi:hypothetical protein